MGGDVVTLAEFAQMAGMDDWTILDSAASAWFECASLTDGAGFLSRITGLTDGTSVPDVDLRAGGVRLRIRGTGPTAFTDKDVALARAISAVARDRGLIADPSALQTLHLSIDTAERRSLLGFWRTALTYELLGVDGLTDPLRRDPTITFHPLEQSRPLRNRIHVDIVRPPSVVDAFKVDLRREPHGAYQLTLGDADGNEIDLVPGDDLLAGRDTDDWAVLFGAMTFYPVSSPRAAAELVSALAGLADHAGIAVLVDLRPEGVTIDSGKDQWEDDVSSAPNRFADLAIRIQSAAHALGHTADTSRLRFVQLVIDAVDVPAVQVFWRSLLSYHHDPRPYLTDIYDPCRLNPVIVFQQMDAAEEDRRAQRNRIHVDLLVPDDQVQPRIDTAIAAGGRAVRSVSPGRCTLIDPEGNEVNLISSGPRS